MRRIGVCAALVAALALPATASANQVKLEGSVKGAPSSQVKVGIKRDHKKIKRVNGLRFRGIPVNCNDGSSGTIEVKLPRFPMHGKKFTRKAKVRGRGIDNGIVRVKGKFRRGGKVLKGKVRLAFKSESGAGCGTDNQRYKATAQRAKANGRR